MTLSRFDMNRLLPFVLLLMPLIGSSQNPCSVSLGDDIVTCNGQPVIITAITDGQSSIDSLLITYDATQGVSGLPGSPKVYFHSGIQIVPFGGWEYTIGNWGADDGIGEMTSVGSDIWEIRISVPDYYGYPGGTNVIGLWMVFRNADGSLTGKDDNDSDIFLETSNNNNSTFTGVTGTDVPGSDGGVLWSTGSADMSISVTVSDTYSVTYTDGVGCVSTDDINVQINTGSTTVNLGPDTALCNGGTLTLDAGSGFSSYEWSTLETSQTIEVDTAGDYAVTVTDQSGCTGIDLIHVEIGMSPDADFSYSAVTGLTVNFTDIGSNADMVHWDFNGDGTDDESTVAGASVQYEFPSESVFGVRMISVNSCGTDTSTQNVLVQDVGIGELKAEIGFVAFPNPVSDNLNISISDHSVSLYNLRILDVSGREILNPSNEVSSNFQFDLTILPTGVYVLQMETSKGMINERILKL